MDVLDLSELGKLVVDVVLLGLLVNARHKEDPALYGALRSRLPLALVLNAVVVAVLAVRGAAVKSTALATLCLVLGHV